MPSENAVTPIDVDLDICEIFKQEAQKKDVSLSLVVNEALRSYLSQRNYEKRIIKEALAESSKGEYISSKSMRDWFVTIGTDDEKPRPETDIFTK